MRVLPSQHEANTCYVVYSGYRTHNEDKTYVYVTRDLGKTWEDISSGMNCPANDIEEDPNNPDLLYLATDYGLYITFDRGKNWMRLTGPQVPDVVINDLAIQKRDREMVVATYGRGIYVVDIYPFKEFTEENLNKSAYLFEIHEGILWQMLDRRGQSYGEFASSPNPPVGVNIYYYLKTKASKLTLVIKDFEGQVVQEINGSVSPGVQRVFWGLNRKSTQTPGQFGFGRLGARLVEPGLYKASLLVDGQEVMSQMIKVNPDPLYK